MNVSKSVLNTFVSPIKSLISETENIDKSNTVIYQGLRDDKKEALIQIRNKAAEVSKLIENIKIDIVSNTEKVDNNEALKIIENLQLLRTKDNYDIPTFIMIGPDQVKGETGRAHELKLKIEEYKNLLLEKSNNDIYKEFANGLLNTSDAYNYHFNGMSTWEMNMFYHTINISTLGILTHLDLNVKLAENEAIKQISSSNGKDSLSIKNIK